MIRVTLPTAPANYEVDVSRPGEAFLRAVPTPTPAQWNQHRYWNLIHDDLYRGLRGICNYCASWSPRRSAGDDHTSIDHFIPKSRAPRLAYSWKNFRLCRERLNNRKKHHSDIVDPCGIRDGVYVIDFDTFQIKPLYSLPQQVARKIRDTIDRLELNTDRDYVNERMRIVRAYSLDEVTMNYVKDRYPFIAQQMSIQDFDVQFKERWRSFFRGRNIRP
jgi:hypothetical protein